MSTVMKTIVSKRIWWKQLFRTNPYQCGTKRTSFNASIMAAIEPATGQEW